MTDEQPTASTEVDVVPHDERRVPTTFEGQLEPNYYCRGWNGKRLKYCKRRAGQGTEHAGEGRCSLHFGNNPSKHGLYSKVRTKRIRQLIEAHAADDKLFDVSTTLATAKALMDDFIERYYELLPMLAAWYATTVPLAEDQRLAVLASLDELEEVYGGAGTAKQLETLALARAAVEHLAKERVDKPRQVLDISDAVKHADTISKIIHRVNLHHSQSAVSYARLSAFMFELNQVLDTLIADRVLLQRITDRILQVRI